uniref:Ig-like domain-containing protein n=1 Tax=Latimeria chalumnae TaxID=7897 RepID=H2ZSA5_LATCH
KHHIFSYTHTSKGIVFVGGQLTVLTDPEPVTAHLGTNVHLNCLFKVGKPQVELTSLAVQWFFNGEKVAEYSNEVHIYSPGVAISEQGLKDGNASLVLTDVRVAHEGDFVCSILYVPDKKERTVTLKVKVLHQFSKSFASNEATELICNVDGYYPKLISVRWLRDGVTQHGSQHNMMRRNEDGTFNITSTYTLTPTDKDKNIWYACRVDHTALMEPLQTKFTLEFKSEYKLHRDGKVFLALKFYQKLFILALVALVILGVWVILWRKAKPEISNIKQLPGPEKSSVMFQLDISNFYPQKITIQW